MRTQYSHILFLLIAIISFSCYPVKVIVIEGDQPLKVQIVNDVHIDTTGALPVRVVNNENPIPPTPPKKIRTCEVGREFRYPDGHGSPCVYGPCTVLSILQEVEVYQYKDGQGSTLVKKIGPFQNMHYPLQKDEFLVSIDGSPVHCEFQ